MTKQEYRSHLCSVILAVFKAEDAINERDPELKSKLRSRTVTADEYLHLIADEMLSATPEEELQRIIEEEA